MRRALAFLLTFTILAGSLEFAFDYGEALEGTSLAALPDGHTSDDGHDPADHETGCDSCHFGGVHLIAFVAAAVDAAPRRDGQFTRWSARQAPHHLLPPPSPPPIA